MSALLEIENLSIAFDTPAGRVLAVDRLSYGVAQGETLGIVGESGSGKSVHALAIAGLLNHPSARILGGSLRFAGCELRGLGLRQWTQIRGRQIGFVFQDPMTALNPLLSIGQQLKAPLKYHLGLSEREATQRCLVLLDQVGIGEPEKRLRQFPHQLSGGLRQRVLLAMGVSLGPKLLIADEATTALDVTVQAQIIDLILALKADLGLSLIWISHDLGVVARLADTVQVMYAGRILERGPVESLFYDPRNAYTLGLLRSLPRPDRQRLQAIPGQPPDLRVAQPGDPFAVRNRYATPRCFVEPPPLCQVPEGAPGHLSANWYDLRPIIAAQGGL